MTPARLRIVSSRAPYRRAGIGFDPTGNKTFGVALVDIAGLDDWRATLKALLEDPHLDVMVGQSIFWPVTCEEDVAELLAAIEDAEPPPAAERRDTLTILAEAAQQDAARAEPQNPPGAEPEGAEPAAGAMPAATTDTTAAAPTGAAPAAEGADTGQAAPAPAAGEASGTPAANPDPPEARPPRRARPAKS